MKGTVVIRHDAYGLPGVREVCLSHPEKRNAMSRSMWAALEAAFVAAHQDPSLRCVVLRGAQGQFCAGGDISEYPSFRFDPAQLRAFHEEVVWGALRAILDCDVPVVALIEGHCMGAGMELASCCDIRIATDSARFGAPIGLLGFPIAPREAALISQVAGASVARAMLLAAAVFDAPALLHRGFLTHVSTSAEFAVVYEGVIRRILQLAPHAARHNKQTLRACTDPGPRSPVHDAAAHYAYADSAEHREGIHAFLSKRPPVF